MSKKIGIIIILIGIIVATVFFEHRKQTAKQKQNSASKTAENSAATPAAPNSTPDADQTSQDFNTQCENGQWVKIADVSGNTQTVSGILRAVNPDDQATADLSDYDYYVEGNPNVGITGNINDTSNLDFFQNREVEVQGLLKSDSVKEINVAQVRCTGKETDKNAINERAKLLNFLSDNISSIAPEKATYQKWSADSAIILDEKDVYVDYYDTIENSDNTDPNLDTMHRVLLEISPDGSGSYKTKVLAYYVPGKDDFSLKQGSDKFKDIDQTTLASYTYDSEDKSWTRD